MTAYYGPADPPAPKRATIADEADMRDRGEHLRGRVTRTRQSNGREYYRYSVVNTVTGQTVCSSDAFTFHNAMTSANVVTALARGAWFWDMERDRLRRSVAREKKLKLSLDEVQVVLTWAMGDKPYNGERVLAKLAEYLGQ